MNLMLLAFAAALTSAGETVAARSAASVEGATVVDWRFGMALAENGAPDNSAPDEDFGRAPEGQSRDPDGNVSPDQSPDVIRPPDEDNEDDGADPPGCVFKKEPLELLV